MSRAERRRQQQKLAEKSANHHKPEEFSTEQALQLATQHHSAGRLPEAKAIYQHILEVDPNQANALHLLGVIGLQTGQYDIAVDLITKSLVNLQSYAAAHNNLGSALDKLGRLDAAVASFYKALAIEPDYAEAQYNLGFVLHKQGKLGDAVECYRKALAIKPDYAEAHFNLSNALRDLGKLDEAVAGYHKALTINPNYAEAWNNLMFTTKACQYSNVGGDLDWESGADGLMDAVRGTANYAIHQFYLAKFRPDKADETFRKAMAALPPKADETVAGHGPGGNRDNPPPRLPSKLVALLHFGRSGSGLMLSLIDAHPEVSTLPSIYLSGFFNAGAWKKIAADGWRGLPMRFADEFAVLFDANSPKPVASGHGEQLRDIGKKEGMTCVGEARSESLYVDREAFCSEACRMMEGLGKVDPRSFLFIVHAAIEKTLETETAKDLIFYHIHNPNDYAMLNFLRYAPDARLVMMIREPIQSCESWIRSAFNNNDYGSIVFRITTMLFAIDQIPFRTQESVGIRLEDLKSRPKETLRCLCTWMGIEETPSLYEMTAQGKKWWGDPSSPDYASNDAMSPFDDVATKRPVGAIFSEEDQRVLRTLFYPFSVRFGYCDADSEQFQKDIQEIRPLLDDMLDFEKTLAERSNIDQDQFKRSNLYHFLRASLIDRWAVLNELGDYPHMLEPLAIE